MMRPALPNLSPARLATLAVAVMLTASALVVLWPGGGVVRVSADFPRTVGLYQGSQVRILGVPVGRVTAIVPAGSSVRVEMVYDAQYKVPADAKAVIVSPSLVGDRFVQFVPGYQGGPVLASGDEIPLKRTRTPVELDRITANLNELVAALGPRGANAEGSLAELLEVGADNLEGQGGNINTSIENLSQAARTLSDGRDDLFGTVRHLQAFVTELARSDKQIRAFTRELAAVSDQLAGERDELKRALRYLAVALGEVEDFVRDNKEALRRNVEDLTEVTTVLARQRAALETIIEVAPLGMGNLAEAYNPVAGSINGRFFPATLSIANDLDGLLCELVKQAGAPDAGETCAMLESLLGPLLSPDATATPIDDLATDVTGGGAAEGGRAADPPLDAPALDGLLGVLGGGS